jgi:hypothetical protein
VRARLWQDPCEYGGPDNHCASASCNVERQGASAKVREKRDALSKLGRARLPFLLSHVHEKPRSIRDFARVQGIDKNTGVARDFMQSLPSAL